VTADPRILGQRLVLWAVIMPLLMGLSLLTGSWFVEAHRYDLPLVAMAHFLFACGGFALLWRHLEAARWLTLAGAAFGLAAGIIVLIVAFTDSHAQYGPFARLALEAFLFLAHAVYVVINLLLLWIGWTIREPGPRRTAPAASPPPPAAASGRTVAEPGPLGGGAASAGGARPSLPDQK
jgi:hypothetical protein